MRTALPASLEGCSTGSADIAAGVSKATRASIVGRCDRNLGALAIALAAEIERRIDRRATDSTAGFVIGRSAAVSRMHRVVRRVLERYRTASLAVLRLRSVGVPVIGCGLAMIQRVGPSERPAVVAVAAVAGPNQWYYCNDTPLSSSTELSLTRR